MYYMNRSILVKQLIFKPNKNFSFYFLFSDVGKYKFKIQPNFNDNVSYNFKYKFMSHYNVKYEIIEKKTNLAITTDTTKYNYLYLTCNTKVKDLTKAEEIGIIKNTNTMQYINYDNQTYVTKAADEFFVKSKKPKELECSENIKELLINSDKMSIIEEKLNRGFEFFSTCIKHTQRFQDCYHTLAIDYNEHTNLILNMFFHTHI
jgi:hypothetical protein